MKYMLDFKITFFAVIIYIILCAGIAESRILFWEAEDMTDTKIANMNEASRGKAVSLSDTLTLSFNTNKPEKYIVWVRAYIDRAGNVFPVEVLSPKMTPLTIFKSNIIKEAYDKKAKNAMQEWFNRKEEVDEKDELGEMMELEEEKKAIAEPPKHEEHRQPDGFYWDSAVISVPAGENILILKNATVKVPSTATLPLVDAIVITDDNKYYKEYPYIIDFAYYKESHVRVIPPKGDGFYSIDVSGLKREHPWSFPRQTLKSSALDGGKKSFALGKPSPWFQMNTWDKFSEGADYTLYVYIIPGEDYEPEEGKFCVEFSLAPNPEYTLRTFEMSGLSGVYVMPFNWNTQPGELFTTEEVSWKHYEMAESLLKSDTYLVPLTSACNYVTYQSAPGQAGNIENRVLRMLGFNVTGNYQAKDKEMRKLMGWKPIAAVYYPNVPPFGTDDIETQALNYWKSQASQFDEETKKELVQYNIADEPGPSQPASWFGGNVWKIEKGVATEYTGNGKLTSKRKDFKNFILEFEQLCHSSSTFGLFVQDDPKTGEPVAKLTWNFHRPSEWVKSWSAVGGLGIRDGSDIKPAPVFGQWHKIGIVTHGKDMRFYLDGQLVKIYTTKEEIPKGGIQFNGDGVLQLRNIRIYKSENPDEEPFIEDKKKKASEDEEDEPQDLDEAVAMGDRSDRLIYEEKFDKTDFAKWIPSRGNPKYISIFRDFLKKQGLKPEDFGRKSWDEIQGIPSASIATTAGDSLLFYWTCKMNHLATSLFFKASTDAIEKVFGRKLPTEVNFTDHGSFFMSNGMSPDGGGIDWISMGRDRGVTAPGAEDWMAYGGWYWYSHHMVTYMIDILRGGSSHYENWTSFHTVYPVRERTISLIGHRVNTLIYWVYGPHYAFTEGMWSEDIGAYQAAYIGARLMSQLEDSSRDAVIRSSKIGFMTSFISEIWGHRTVFWEKMPIYLALHHGQHPVEIMTEEDILTERLARYKVLVYADNYIEKKKSPIIEQWVKNGGVLLADYQCGEYNEGNVKENFLERFGIRFAGSDTLPVSSVIRGVKGSILEGDTLNVSPNRLWLECDRQFEKLAEYGDGKPAIIKVNYGKGAVYAYAYRMGFAYSDNAQIPGGVRDKWKTEGEWHAIVNPVRQYVPPVVEDVPPCLEADVWEYADGNVIVFNDWIWRGEIKTGFRIRTDFSPKEVTSSLSGRLDFDVKKVSDGYEVSVKELKINEGDLIAIRKEPKKEFARNLAPYNAKSDTDIRALTLWLGGFGYTKISNNDIIDGIKSSDEWLRMWAIDAGGRLRKKELEGEFLRLCRDVSPWVRMRAIWALRRVNPDKGHAIAKGMLADVFPLVRKYAILSLDTGAKETVDLVKPMLSQIDGRVVYASSQKLTECGYTPDLPVVMEMLKKSGYVNSAGVLFLPELWKRETKQMIEIVKSEKMDNWTLLSTLGSRKDDLAETLLKDFLKNGSGSVKYMSAYYLAGIWQEKPERADLRLYIDNFGKGIDHILADSLYRITGKVKGNKWK